MRVYLTDSELRTESGNALLALTVRIATDGRLDRDEIIELRQWLRANESNDSINAIGYLHDIMTRITSDNVIDRDELLQLFLAVERVIPATHRTPITQARQKRNAARRERHREERRIAKEKEQEERKRMREEREREFLRLMRMRHSFAKIAGVTYPNDDGSERQDLIKRCKPGEQIVFRHDVDNQYSIFATEILRTNGDQLGYAPEYLAEKIVNEIDNGCNVVGAIADLTGGTFDQPTRGVNFCVFFIAKDVTDAELQQYANKVFAEEA